MKVGITLVAVFMLTMFSLSAFTSVTVLIAKQDFADAFREETERYGIDSIKIEEIIPYVAGIGFLFSLIYLLTGIGLIVRNELSRKVGIGIGILHGIYGLLTLYIPEIGGLNLAISIALIYYLTRKDVKEEFVQVTSIEERVLGKDWEGKIN